MKRCARCGETKPLDEFPARSRKQARDGQLRNLSSLLPRMEPRTHSASGEQPIPNAHDALQPKTPGAFARRTLITTVSGTARHLEAERERSRLAMRDFRKAESRNRARTQTTLPPSEPRDRPPRERENTHRRRALCEFGITRARRAYGATAARTVCLLRSYREHHGRPRRAVVTGRQARSEQPRSCLLLLQLLQGAMHASEWEWRSRPSLA